MWKLYNLEERKQVLFKSDRYLHWKEINAQTIKINESASMLLDITVIFYAGNLEILFMIAGKVHKIYFRNIENKLYEKIVKLSWSLC